MSYEHLLDDLVEDSWEAKLPASVRAKSGVNAALEEQADAILNQDRKQYTKISDMNDWLSDQQIERRVGREVYNKFGVPEAGLFRGIARRAYNPLLHKHSRRESNGDED